VDRPFVKGPLTRLTSSVAIRERRNPFFMEDDLRRTVAARGERTLGRFVRAGLSGTLSRVSFGSVHQSLATWGTDVAFDTRRSPDLPRNAIFVQVGWDRVVSGGQSIDRYRADARAYVGLPGASTIAFRALRAGAETVLPSYEQYLFGGTSSVRGFRAGSDVGDRLALGSVEWRVPLTSPVSFGRAGASLFADTGAVHSATDRLQDVRFRTGVGAGLFFNAAIFNLNLDVARGLGGGFRLHVSSGFQF
jgi:outer membrane protein assembly factor BamA